MNRELLNNAKEIEEKIKQIESIEINKDEAVFFAIDSIHWLAGEKVRIPDFLCEDIFDAIQKRKEILEKQLEEL